jgi:hypothetical protein
VEDRLAAAGTDVDQDPVVLEPGVAGDLGDEVEHALRLLCGKLAHVAERLDVPLRDDEEMRLRLRVDVPDRDEAVRLRDGIALLVERAEEAVVRQRGSPPP